MCAIGTHNHGQCPCGSGVFERLHLAKIGVYPYETAVSFPLIGRSRAHRDFQDGGPGRLVVICHRDRTDPPEGRQERISPLMVPNGQPFVVQTSSPISNATISAPIFTNGTGTTYSTPTFSRVHCGAWGVSAHWVMTAGVSISSR